MWPFKKKVEEVKKKSKIKYKSNHELIEVETILRDVKLILKNGKIRKFIIQGIIHSDTVEICLLTGERVTMYPWYGPTGFSSRMKPSASSSDITFYLSDSTIRYKDTKDRYHEIRSSDILEIVASPPYLSGKFIKCDYFTLEKLDEN